MTLPTAMNVQVVAWATEAIRKHLGSLDDLPDELANTIANIYYGAGQIILEDASPSSLVQAMKRTADLEELPHLYAQGITSLERVKMIPEMVSGLRSVNKAAQPHLYRMTWNVVLDVLKYDIKNAMDKPEIWRLMERFFRKPAIDEIPRLAELFRQTLSVTE